MHARGLLTTLAAAAALATCLTTSCASETSRRPAPRTPPAAVASSSSPQPALPFPDTAFTDERGQPPASRASPASPGPPATPSRFDTRRIGGEDDGRDERSLRHRGAPVDLDLKGADLGDVFRLLSEVGKVSIVVSGDVTGTITLRLRHVPWDQALDVIARAKGLTVERDGSVIVVRGPAR